MSDSGTNTPRTDHDVDDTRRVTEPKASFNTTELLDHVDGR
ncbi:MAG: hypothetical protein ACXWDM_06630 [Nocardioides sp.]